MTLTTQGETIMKKNVRTLCVIVAACLISGCAGAMRNYNNELKQTISKAESGQIDHALVDLDSNNKSENKDLLYYLEKGELLTLKKSHSESLEARLKADEKIKIWEEEQKLTAQKITQGAGSLIVNDKVRRYDGRDYEKVFLNSRLVLNQLAVGDWDKARVEVKRMHEREALIAEIRAKEIEKAEQEANSKGINTTYKELKGYPVETLDDPEVVGLKNAYQNAFSHYMAGYLYESLGERSLAAAGYRKAIELRPNLSLLENGLKEVDNRYKSISKDKTDLLVVVETGTAPAYDSISIPIPIPAGGSLLVTPISFPIVKEDSNTFKPTNIAVGSQDLPLDMVTNVNVMARRALRDEMPGIILRSIVRATTKAVAQKAANDNDSSGLSGLILMIGGLIVEGADERIWRTLPSNVSLARATVNRGANTITLQTPNGPITQNIELKSRYSVLNIRVLGNQMYVTEINAPAQVENMQAYEVEPVIKAIAEEVVTPQAPPKKKVKTKSKSAKKVS
jgi:uncharacterized protein